MITRCADPLSWIRACKNKLTRAQSRNNLSMNSSMCVIYFQILIEIPIQIRKRQLQILKFAFTTPNIGVLNRAPFVSVTN